MRVGYLDMFSGVSGDMLLGACLAAGIRLEELEAALESLDLPGVRIRTERVERQGIAATRCHVDVPDTAHQRHLQEILDRIAAAELPPRVAERSRRVFQRLAAAESAVHGTTPEEVHFHEVGALDAIVDIVGGAWCLERLGIERLYASRFTLGSGWVTAAHGRLPVPPPAVLELVAGWPATGGTVEAELTTPTGAALVTTLAEGRGWPPDFVVEQTSYGAGTRELPGQPNLLRLVLGTVSAGAESLALIECDLDDLSPQLFEPLAEALTEAGALDVSWAALQMKKRRPGVAVRVLAPLTQVPAIGAALFRESTTIGYRWWPIGRETLAREAVELETSWGRVPAKRVRRPDGGWELRPEFEACRALARQRGVAVRDVMAALAVELATGDASSRNPAP
ncbi:MAG: nickel pincer cofactor biosynthesis protein LarC [Gemmatimonadota bacterium]